MLYLGPVIDATGLSPESAKLKVVAEWPIPKRVQELQSFLRFVNFYNDLLINATQLTSELYEWTASKKGDEIVQVTQHNIAAFDKIKRGLDAENRLKHLYLERPFVHYTDASEIAVGAVLFQNHSMNVKRDISFCFEKVMIWQTKLLDVWPRVFGSDLDPRTLLCVPPW